MPPPTINRSHIGGVILSVTPTAETQHTRYDGGGERGTAAPGNRRPLAGGEKVSAGSRAR